MKICMIVDESGGGFGNYSNALAVNLTLRGHEVHIFAPHHPELRSVFARCSVSLHTVETPSFPIFRKPLYYMLLRRQLQRFLKKEKPDLLHINGPTTVVMPNVANIAFVPTFHGLSYCTIESLSGIRMKRSDSELFALNKYALTASRLFERQLLHMSNHVIAVSKWTRDNIVRYYDMPERKVSLIYNSIDTKLFCPYKNMKNDKRPKILWVGRFDEIKDVDTLIEAMPFVLSEECSVETEKTKAAEKEEIYKRRTVSGLYQALAYTKPPYLLKLFYVLLPFACPLLLVLGKRGYFWMRGILLGLIDYLRGDRTGVWQPTYG